MTTSRLSVCAAALVGLGLFTAPALSATPSGTVSLTAPRIAHQDPSVPGPTPDAQLAASKAAALRASSLFVFGRTPLLKMTYTVRYLGDERAHLRVTIKKTRRIQVIQISGTTYIRANAAYYRGIGATGEIARQIAGRWFRGDPTGIDPSFLKRPIFIGLIMTPSGKARVSGSGQVKGQAVTLLRDEDENGTFAIRSSGVPYPVSIDYDAKDLGVINFSKWGEKATITAPRRFTDLPPIDGEVKRPGAPGV